MEEETQPDIIDRIFDNKTSVVYIVRSGKFIKIGKSNTRHVDTRLRDLQVGNPNKIEIEALMLGDVKLERKLHKLADKEWVRGEWFKLTYKQVKNLIGEMPLLYGKYA